jgi:hypothetical protein
VEEGVVQRVGNFLKFELEEIEKEKEKGGVIVRVGEWWCGYKVRGNEWV